MSNLNDVHTRFGGYAIQEGQLVSERVQRIVEAIKDYEPEIEVRWIPDRAARDENVPQFKVVHVPPGNPEFILFHVNNEEEFDERVLHRIIQNDQRRSNVTLSDFEAWEETQRLINRQLYLDALEEAADVAAHVFATHKNTYKVNDSLTIKEGIPFNANRLNDPKFISASQIKRKDKEV